MGKDLKGKELGIGLCQRKDKRYSARVSIDGKRYEKIFNTITEARKWIAEPIIGVEYDLQDITVGECFAKFVALREGIVCSTTINNYEWLYKKHIKENVENMLVRKVKDIDLQNVLNDAIAKGKTVGTVDKIKQLLNLIFKFAKKNKIIDYNPAYDLEIPPKKTKDTIFLTVDEQKKFVKRLHKQKYRLIYLLILETGLRIGEATGLKWEDIDFNEKCLYVKRNIVLNKKTKELEVHEGKTQKAIRRIPLTIKAIDILLEQKKNMPNIINKNWVGYIFIFRDGNIAKSANVYATLKSIVKTMGMNEISVHSLRHTFATRCIEAGMRPKTLQKILGHASITTTMNLYVHVSSEETVKEMEKFERYLIS